MKAAAKALEFEKAAMLRDQIFEMRTTMAVKEDLPPWKRIHTLAGES
jgi:excinuclease ABC subunit B